MKPVRLHTPGVPDQAEPPTPLLRLADSLRHPQVIRCGVTTTKDGRWALYVTVPADTSVPLPEVEARAKGFPVVYEAEPASPPIARPAFPKKKRPGS